MSKKEPKKENKSLNPKKDFEKEATKKESPKESKRVFDFKNLKNNYKIIIGIVFSILLLLAIIVGYFGYSFWNDRSEVESYLDNDYKAYSEINSEVDTLIKDIDFEQDLTTDSINEELENNLSNSSKIEEIQNKIVTYKDNYSESNDQKIVNNLSKLVSEDLENDYQNLEVLKKDLEFKSCIESKVLIYLESNKNFRENSQAIVSAGENPDQASAVIDSIIGEIDKTIQNNTEVKKCYEGDFEVYGGEGFNIEIEELTKYFTDLKNILNSMKQNMRIKDSSAINKDNEALKEISKREISTKTPSFILNYKEKLKIEEKLSKDGEFKAKVENEKQALSEKYYVSK